MLVVAPAAVRPMWLYELDKWLDCCDGSDTQASTVQPWSRGGRVVSVRGIGGQFDAWHDPRDRYPPADATLATSSETNSDRTKSSSRAGWVGREDSTWSSVTVTSYEMLRRLPEMATDPTWRWSLVVLDEAHVHMRTPSRKVCSIPTKRCCHSNLRNSALGAAGWHDVSSSTDDCCKELRWLRRCDRNSSYNSGAGHFLDGRCHNARKSVWYQ